ncbi:MAG TPA: GAF domain-containing sensor histidine kinase [Anaerolineae bacterium]|nr:GAF domain-containing sensor histidine kinase [Anaerolineae bacterium]
MTNQGNKQPQPSANLYSWAVWAVFATTIIILSGIFYFVISAILDTNAITIVAVGIVFILLAAGTIAGYTSWYGPWVTERALSSVNADIYSLELESKRAAAIQSMVSTLRATLSFERSLKTAIDVSIQTLQDLGLEPRKTVAAIYLFEGEMLRLFAHQNLDGPDHAKELTGQLGLVAEAFEHAEPVVSPNPSNDIEFKQFLSFRRCEYVVCIPLRAGYQIFGVFILGIEETYQFTDNDMKFFTAVADQAVIALQNAQLYQDLESEKQRLVAAQEEANKKLARDLHDGPTQSVAIIAMRLNFIREIINKDPSKAIEELEKIEELANNTSKEIRGMLFTLRPLVLENQGLGAAIEMGMKRTEEQDKSIKMELVGGENGDLLNDKAQGVVFYIIEEALGNARKYSKASLIQVQLWRHDDLFVARIKDDGVGFDTRKVLGNYSSRGSLGMVNMQERAALIDGSLKIESSPGKGTTITLVVPLDKHGRKN